MPSRADGLLEMIISENQHGVQLSVSVARVWCGRIWSGGWNELVGALEFEVVDKKEGLKNESESEVCGR
jgi:hypothetical protein